MKKLVMGQSKLLLVLALSMMSAGARSRTAGPQDPEWVAPPREARKANPLPDDQATIGKGKVVFMANCLPCHGETGVGNGPGAKDLPKHPGDLTSRGIQDQPDGALFWKISTGRPPMTAFQGTLSAEERWEVIRFVRTFGKASTPTSVPTIDAPEALRSSLTTLFEAYGTCGASLAKGDDKAAAAACPGLQSAVEQMRKVALEGAPAQTSSAWKDTVESVSNVVDGLAKSADLPARRAAFRLVSTKAEAAWEQFGHTRKDPLYVFVAADGAAWVQADRSPSNPYGQAKDAAEAKLDKMLAATRPKEPAVKPGEQKETH
jgi:mono/diheme cytochrome c family protein